MSWSEWLKLPFNGDGTLNLQSLNRVPDKPGVYAIGSDQQTGQYVTHYVGRSKNIRERLRRHLTGHGNSVIASQLALKRSVPLAPAKICVAYLETNEPKIVEAVYIDTADLPICNLIRARLPAGLSQVLVQRAELEK
jgi:hypothetical protein